MQNLNTRFSAARNYYRRVRAFMGRPLLVRQQSIVTVEDLEPCPNPIFLLGCHRSGTSLVRRIVNSHSNIACPPETNFLIHYFNMLKDPESVAGLSGMVREDLVVQEVMKQAFRFHEGFRVTNKKMRWADKTPQYVYHFDDIARYAPPATQYVVILRHPFDIAYSIYSRGWRLKELHEDLLTNSCLYVKETVERLIAIQQRPGICTLRYEDLVRDPDDATRRLCEYLSEPWDEGMTRPWDFSHNFGTEDPISRSQKKFELSSENWRALPAPDSKKMADILGEVTRRLGYTND